MAWFIFTLVHCLFKNISQGFWWPVRCSSISKNAWCGFSLIIKNSRALCKKPLNWSASTPCTGHCWTFQKEMRCVCVYIYILLCPWYFIPEGLIEKYCQATCENICVQLLSGFKSKAGKVTQNAIALKRCRVMDKLWCKNLLSYVSHKRIRAERWRPSSLIEIRASRLKGPRVSKVSGKKL